MSPELRLLVAGAVFGAVLLLALELVALLWWVGRQEEAELYGPRRGGMLGPASTRGER